MEWSTVKTIEFCNDYQKRPLLWRATHVDYKNRIKRRDAIQELAVLYGMDYKGVVNKIKSLRSYFHREQLNLKKKITKSGSSGDENTSTWFAYKHLQFIAGEDVECNAKDTMGLDDSSVTEEVVIDDNGEEQLSDTNENQNQDIPQHQMKQPLKRQKVMAKKKEEVMIADAYSFLKSVKDNKPDEASIFGDLIAEKIRRLPISVRPIAQHAVLCTLLEYEINTIGRPVSMCSNYTASSSNSNKFGGDSNESTSAAVTPATSVAEWEDSRDGSQDLLNELFQD